MGVSDSRVEAAAKDRLARTMLECAAKLRTFGNEEPRAVADVLEREVLAAADAVGEDRPRCSYCGYVWRPDLAHSPECPGGGVEGDRPCAVCGDPRGCNPDGVCPPGGGVEPSREDRQDEFTTISARFVESMKTEAPSPMSDAYWLEAQDRRVGELEARVVELEAALRKAYADTHSEDVPMEVLNLLNPDVLAAAGEGEKPGDLLTPEGFKRRLLTDATFRYAFEQGRAYAGEGEDRPRDLGEPDCVCTTLYPRHCPRCSGSRLPEQEEA